MNNSKNYKNILILSFLYNIFNCCKLFILDISVSPLILSKIIEVYTFHLYYKILLYYVHNSKVYILKGIYLVQFVMDIKLVTR